MSTIVLYGHIYTAGEIYKSSRYLIERVELFRWTDNSESPPMTRGFRVVNLKTGITNVYHKELADQLIYSLSYLSSKDFEPELSDDYLEKGQELDDFSLKVLTSLVPEVKQSEDSRIKVH
jgi:hypothetical protein